MSLIAICIYCTEINGRLEYAKKCLESLVNTVDLTKHRLFLIDNASCEEAQNFLLDFINKYPATLMRNSENLGTARGINRALKERIPNEMCIKMDEDVVINQSGWVEEMEMIIDRDPNIGIVGLKRKDVDWDGQYIALPHEPGQRWLMVEKGTYIMGTCTMFNPKLMDTIGGMRHPSPYYGLDDTLYSLRSELAGFWNCYLPHIDIDHIDRGDNEYAKVKQRQASEVWPVYMDWHKGYLNGTKKLWEEFE